jgi:hypothetical protein
VDLAGKIEDIFRAGPVAERTRNEWGDPNAPIALTIDPDRANLAGFRRLPLFIFSRIGVIGDCRESCVDMPLCG